jgi:hypothetical protein
MAQQRLRDTFTQLVQSARRFSLSRDNFFWLWRSGLMGRPATQEGFILPTVTLLLLILSLVVGLLIFRTFNRTEQVSGERKQKVIYNYATPAIDRAKAKIEYLFTAEAMPVVPRDSEITKFIKNGTYNLPNERRIDINGDGVANSGDQAWVYDVDIDGDGDLEKVAYSLLTAANTDAVRNNAGVVVTPGLSLASPVSLNKAQKGVVRNGPINLLGTSSGAQCQNVTTVREQAWQDVGRVLRKALQVNAVVIGSSKGGQVPVATLEMQQDREAPKNPKWGAWFRTDMEITPGPTFRWNGAMHSEGSFFVASGNPNNSQLDLHLISSPSSCVFDSEASTLTNRRRTETPRVGGVAGAPYDFIGYFVLGSIRNNTYTTFSPTVRIVPYSDNAGTLNNTGNWFTLTADNDSFSQLSNPATSAIAIDPIVLLNEDRNANYAGAAVGSDNHENLRGQPGVAGRIVDRITTNSQPYVDDTFRADNRYGPKSSYNRPDGNGDPIKLTATNVAGNPILTTDANFVDLTRDDPTIDAGSGTALRRGDIYDETTFGYDGYWERRAIKQGVRVIVGQRLELGNTFGWNGTGPTGNNTDPGNDSEPLYPPTPGATTGLFANRRHEQKQLRTLRDNLSAVQATAVYHYNKATDGGNFPVACVATTAHPATPATIKASTTFNTISVANAPVVNVDFLNGKGTNGWEFAPPAANDSAFGSALSGELGDALRNLAYFTGDPGGGLPSFKYEPTGTARVYPNPIHTMWGDFSNLRRIMVANPNLATAYSTRADAGGLSPADRSTLHTAACTVQMLAYNIRNATTSDLLGSLRANGNADLDVLVTAIDFITQTNQPTKPDQASMKAAIYKRLVAQAVPLDAINRIKVALDQTTSYIQIQRDRRYGFKKSDSTTASNTEYTLAYVASMSYQQFNPATNFWVANGPIGAGQVIPLNFNFAEGNYLGLGQPTNDVDEARFVKIADALGGGTPGLAPKYPALFYIFPIVPHGINGDPAVGNNQPLNEDYIVNAGNISLLHDNYQFRPVNPASTTVLGTPRPVPGATGATPTNWTTPVRGVATNAQTCTAGLSCNVVTYQPPLPPGAAAPLQPRYMRTSFLDKVIYNGREAMAVRVLDVDLDLLRNSTLNNSGAPVDSWLPIPSFTPTDTTYQTKTGAIYYSFREDAVREDTIQRPAAGGALNTLSQYMTATGTFPTAAFNMSAVGTLAQQNDLARTALGISPKPVDYFADPDRRPHGFRLRNGDDLRRPGMQDDMRGLSFVSDNPVYIQDMFNRHANANNGAPREEFQTPLNQADWSNFYNRNDLDPNFSCEPTLTDTSCTVGDRWRPVEVIADSITLLSGGFRDGSIAEGLFVNRSALNNNTRMSFTHATVPQVLNNGNAIPADIRWRSEDRLHTSNAATNAPLPLQPTAAPTSAPKRCEEDENQGWDYYVPTPANPNPNSTNLPNNLTLPPLPCAPVKVDRDNYFVGQGNGTEGPVGKAAAGFTTVTAQPVRFWLLNETGGNSDSVNRRGWLTQPNPTTFNLTFVSGLTPSRPNSGNGGLHNFPRFLEGWTANSPVTFAGAMVQINFSNYATAPFDQIAWEPGTTASSNERISYYGAPGRRWGYDVALQYAPPGPISQRFLAPIKRRSEFYRDLPVDDPYVKMLRCAKDTAGVRVDPNATGECPP